MHNSLKFIDNFNNEAKLAIKCESSTFIHEDLTGTKGRIKSKCCCKIIKNSTVGLFFSPLDLRQYRKIVARVAFQLIYRIQIDLREREFDQLLLKHRNPKNKIRKVARPRIKLTLRT